MMGVVGVTCHHLVKRYLIFTCTVVTTYYSSTSQPQQSCSWTFRFLFSLTTIGTTSMWSPLVLVVVPLPVRPNDPE